MSEQKNIRRLRSRVRHLERAIKAIAWLKKDVENNVATIQDETVRKTASERQTRYFAEIVYGLEDDLDRSQSTLRKLEAEGGDA